MVKSYLFQARFDFPLPDSLRGQPLPSQRHRSAWPAASRCRAASLAASRAASRLKGRNVLETELMSYKEMYYI